MAKSRLWRLRRMNGQIDAEIRDAGDDGVEIRITLNGELVYQQRYGDRSRAVAEAAAKRADLERSGWTEHW